MAVKNGSKEEGHSANRWTLRKGASDKRQTIELRKMNYSVNFFPTIWPSYPAADKTVRMKKNCVDSKLEMHLDSDVCVQDEVTSEACRELPCRIQATNSKGMGETKVFWGID